MSRRGRRKVHQPVQTSLVTDFFGSSTDSRQIVTSIIDDILTEVDARTRPELVAKGIIADILQSICMNEKEKPKRHTGIHMKNPRKF